MRRCDPTKRHQASALLIRVIAWLSPKRVEFSISGPIQIAATTCASANIPTRRRRAKTALTEPAIWSSSLASFQSLPVQIEDHN
jgi:hypothetical protein